MKLSVKALGIASGTILGFSLFLTTIWFIIMNYHGQQLSLVGSIYIGYSVTWIGAFIGLIYGFIDGFIFGALFAYIYNKFAK